MQGTLFPESATMRTSRECATVLRRLRAEWRLSPPHKKTGFTLVHKGEDIDYFDTSSRYVYKLPDQPFVVKLDHGECPTQSWHEWAYWHDNIKGSGYEHLFAPTRAIHISTFEYPIRAWETQKIVRWETRLCVMTIQDYIDEGNSQDDAYVLEPESACRRQCTNYIKSEFNLADIDSNQCRYSAERGHWVLVDYGLDAGWAGGARVKERDKVFEEVRMTEKPWSRPT